MLVTLGNWIRPTRAEEVVSLTTIGLLARVWSHHNTIFIVAMTRPRGTGAGKIGARLARRLAAEPVPPIDSEGGGAQSDLIRFSCLVVGGAGGRTTRHGV